MYFRRTLELGGGESSRVDTHPRGANNNKKKPHGASRGQKDEEEEGSSSAEGGVGSRPRFHYLGDQPLEITNSLKGYNSYTVKSPQQNQPHNPETKRCAVYEMEPELFTKGGNSCSQMTTKKCLKWSAASLIVILILALAAYLVLLSSIEEPEVIFDAESSSQTVHHIDNTLGDLEDSSLKEHVAGNVELQAQASSSNLRDRDGNYIEDEDLDLDLPHQTRVPPPHVSNSTTEHDTDSDTDLMYSDSDITFIDKLLSSFKRTFEKDGHHSDIRPVTITISTNNSTTQPQVSSTVGVYQEDDRRRLVPVSPTLPSLLEQTLSSSSTSSRSPGIHHEHAPAPGSGLRRINSTSIRHNTRPANKLHHSITPQHITSTIHQNFNSSIPATNDEGSSSTSGGSVVCVSPRVDMCRGVLPWDLTTLPHIPGLDTHQQLIEALPYFELVAASNCSPRIKQFLCSLLEPQCQPPGTPLLPPICVVLLCSLAVAEECSDFILDSLDLSRVFNCHNYPDTDDQQECVNLARGVSCERGEFRCELEGSCIPESWRCDNVKHCTTGEDEHNCTHIHPRQHPRPQKRQLCHHHQFRCLNGVECIGLELTCDGSAHCSDGSDEIHCPPHHKDYVGHRSGCPRGELRCLDGRCITISQICDGRQDCTDSADEANCPTLDNTQPKLS